MSVPARAQAPMVDAASIASAGSRPIWVRPLRDQDVDAVARLNEAAVPAVNALGTDGLRDLLQLCDTALVATVDGPETDEPRGLVLAVAPGSDYASENYAWFSAHVPGSLYVDRIVVDPAAHGLGVGRALYASVEQRARDLGVARLTCEVNLEPPNPSSMAFHERLGFRRVGEQDTKDGSVRVALLVRDL